MLRYYWRLWIIVSLLIFHLSPLTVANEQATPTSVSDSLLYDRDHSDATANCQLQKDVPGSGYYWQDYDYGIRTVTYFDPATCSGSPTYPFIFNTFSFTLYDPETAEWPVDVDVVIYDLAVSGNPCAGPGLELKRFGVTCLPGHFAFPHFGTVDIPGRVCVGGPFYMGIEYRSTSGGPYSSVLFDSTEATVCDNWMYSAGQWVEWNDFWTAPAPGYPRFKVVGETDFSGLATGFSASPRFGAAPLQVAFSEEVRTCGTIGSWLWRFGDGDSSTAANPIHTYSNPGEYDVSLSVVSSAGTDTLVKASFVSVIDSTGVVGFNVQRPFSCEAWTIKSSDLDRDNNADLVFSGMLSRNGVWVSYGNGSAGFSTPQQISSLVSGAGLRVGFVNQDSLPDIVAVDDNRIQIFLNNGSRNYTTRSYSHSWISTTDVCIGYFNDDAYADFLVSPRRMLFGDGQGGFLSSATFPDTVKTAEVSDFNGDGFDDIVGSAGYAGVNSVTIFLNDGSGNFTASWSNLLLNITSYSGTTANSMADFDRDGNSDFVMMIPPPGGITYSHILVGLGDGLGGVKRLDSISVQGVCYNVLATDINRDHRLDLVLVDGAQKEMEIYFGLAGGDFTFAQRVALPTTNVPFSFTSADFDRDGNPDVAIAALLPYVAIDNLIVLINTLPDAPVLADEMVATVYNTASIGVKNPDSFEISRSYRTVASADYWRLDSDRNGEIDESSADFNLVYGEYQFAIFRRTNSAPDSRLNCGIRIDGTQNRVIFHNYSTPDFGDTMLFYFTVESESSINPPNGLPWPNLRPTLNWSGLLDKKFPAADSFQLQLDRYYDFRSPIYDVSGLASPSFKVAADLIPDSVYYWRVRPFSAGVPSDYSRIFALYIVPPRPYVPGDANGSGMITISDAVFLINFIFSGGASPDPVEAGDANCSGLITISDVVYLINYIFSGGAAPCD